MCPYRVENTEVMSSNLICTAFDENNQGAFTETFNTCVRLKDLNTFNVHD